MLRRFIVFLVRKKLGLKKREAFRFVNQKSKTDFYYFDKDCLVKSSDICTELSGVSLNWLLDDNCEIIRGLED